MATDRFQTDPYGPDNAVGQYPGPDYGYEAPGQYRTAEYRSGASTGEYGSYGYDVPADDYRRYERGPASSAGQYRGNDYPAGQAGQYGYGWPAGDTQLNQRDSYGSTDRYAGGGYRYETPAGGYGGGDGYGSDLYGSRYAGNAYGDGAPASEYRSGGYAGDPLGTQYRSGGYGPAAPAQGGYEVPADRYRGGGYAGGPATGYVTGPPTGYGAAVPTAYPNDPATGYVTGPSTGYGAAVPTAYQNDPATAYANGPATGYASGYATEAPAAPYRGAGYASATPAQYVFEAPSGLFRPDGSTPEAPAGWYRPNDRGGNATDVLPVTEDGADIGVEVETGDVPQASTSTALARISDVTPNVETIGTRRQAARSESRISEAMQRRILLVLALAGLATTMWLWWLGSFAGSLDSSENLVAGVAQIAGMVGEYLILVQVLLMARIPWLERAIGTELLTKVHVILGFSVMAFITEHIIGAIVLNMPSDTPAVPGLLGVFFGLRDVLSATVGTALMFGVVYLSTKKVRSRIPYEVWRYLHLFVYLGISLEFLHQMSLGVHFLNSHAAKYFWLALHAIALYCVAWYRFGVIIRMNLLHRLRVDNVVEEGPGVYSIYFTGNRLDKFSGTAGQFCRWRFLNREGWWQSHPFSLSAAPTSKYLRITVKQLGDWTNLHLPDLETGTPVFFSGPYGGLTPERRKRRKVLLVAAGIGITPMRSLLAGLPAEPGEITLLYRASAEKDLVFREELDELARQRGATVHYLIGPRDRFKGGDPLGASQLKELVPGLHRHDVYLCGPEGMLSAAVAGLRGARVPRRQIHTERFAF